MTTTARTTRFGLLQIGIIVLTIATAAIHLVLGIQFGNTLFYLNALGYVTLLAAYFLPQLSGYRGLVRWALIGFAAITILAWFFLNFLNGMGSLVGYIDKLIEIALIVLLFLDGRR